MEQPEVPGTPPRAGWTRRRKVLVAVALSLLGLLCVLAAVFLWACGGLQSPGTFEGEVIDFGQGVAPAPAAELSTGEARKLVVLTWNVAYAQGIGSGGAGYEPRTAGEMERALERMAGVIRESRADVVLLQEIDFDSDRSHNVDQLARLAELSRATGLRYAARALSWKAGYVPFPYWPPRLHFGRMRSGGAVLSRFPVTHNRVTLHPKPRSNSWVVNAFYLFRFSQVVRIAWGETEVVIVNSHLEAYDTANREEQARALAATVRALAGDGETLVIVGGDMNAVPPGSKARDFGDHTDDDYTGDRTLDVLGAMPGLREVAGDEAYCGNDSAYFTFPANEPNRRLDYVFASDRFAVRDARVLSAGDCSDHLPVRAELALRERRSTE